MLLSNTSRYPTDTAVRLVRYAFRGVQAAGVGVVLRDLPQRPGRPLNPGVGRAFPGLPGRSIYRQERGVYRQVDLDMGPPEAFPSDNLVRKFRRIRQVPLTHAMLYDEHGYRRSSDDAIQYIKGTLRGNEAIKTVSMRRRTVTVGVLEEIPYGGPTSPHYYYLDWIEGLVSYAAHEARHIWQFNQRDREWKNGVARRDLTARSEADAEQHAFKVLECFRRERAEVLGSPVRFAAKRRQDDHPLVGFARLLSPHEDVTGG